MEFTLLWAVLTAAVLGWLGLRLWSDGLPENASDRLIGAGVIGLVVGRTTAMLAQGINPVTNIGEFIIIRGGVHTAAAAAGFAVALVWATRQTPGAVDAMAPAVMLALAGWHAGCIWRGACLGSVSDLPWAWGLPGSAVTRHPVEVYAAIALALGAWLVSRLGWGPWLRSGAALAGISLTRLLSEPLRPSITGGPIGWYLIGALLGVLVMVVGPILPRRAPLAST